MLLVCTRWCLHQSREDTSLSPHKRSSVATIGTELDQGDKARTGWVVIECFRNRRGPQAARSPWRVASQN
jgi:hypothetical protein